MTGIFLSSSLFWHLRQDFSKFGAHGFKQAEWRLSFRDLLVSAPSVFIPRWTLPPVSGSYTQVLNSGLYGKHFAHWAIFPKLVPVKQLCDRAVCLHFCISLPHTRYELWIKYLKFSFLFLPVFFTASNNVKQLFWKHLIWVISFVAKAWHFLLSLLCIEQSICR